MERQPGPPTTIPAAVLSELPAELATLQAAFVDFGAKPAQRRRYFDQVLAEMRHRLGAHGATVLILNAFEIVEPLHKAFLQARAAGDRPGMIIARAEGRVALDGFLKSAGG